MRNLTINVYPGSDIAVAHRAAVNAALGSLIENFRYDPVTGIVSLTLRAIPPFGLLDAESEESKTVARIIADYETANRDITRRETDVANREREVTRKERDVKQREDELDGVIRPGLIARTIDRMRPRT